MSETIVVQAKVLSLGDNRQITAKSDGRQHTFFTVECQVGEESVTYESGGWNRGKIEVGRCYELEVLPKDNPEYLPSITKVTLNNNTDSVPNMGENLYDTFAADTPQPQSKATIDTQKQPATSTPSIRSTQQSPIKVDFGSRWREWNTHFRTSQMQATARVELYTSLILAGKLFADNGEPITAVKKSTLEGWWSEEIDRYWNEFAVRFPSDCFGDLLEPSNG
jgi:hypothetical protein